jgi:hypothetical protein
MGECCSVRRVHRCLDIIASHSQRLQRYPGASQRTTSIVATGFLQAPLWSEMHGVLVYCSHSSFLIFLCPRAILHDEVRHLIFPGPRFILSASQRVYPEPHTFKPERFLLDGKLNPAVKNPEAAFGFGRRCVYLFLPPIAIPSTHMGFPDSVPEDTWPSRRSGSLLCPFSRLSI